MFRTQADLRFAGPKDRCHRGVVERSVDVGEHQPARVLGLRRAHQSPHRGPGQIADVFARHRHRAAGDNDQRPGVALAQPRLHRGQRLVGALVDACRRIGGQRLEYLVRRRRFGASRRGR
ncbi:hypothetical protein MNVI_42940 [Mycobacterium noviomagense]|uniref:Uncharacterized protein n=1 Tax=Mycobacterium noviomagense TaxID=459858 RepID=A0A7I7PK79_9MYCO|nr:hypothetical protein MNVI_42940 [Mycobacterium noviomagense]